LKSLEKRTGVASKEDVCNRARSLSRLGVATSRGLKWEALPYVESTRVECSFAGGTLVLGRTQPHEKPG
jgi:hypothetical protein